MDSIIDYTVVNISSSAHYKVQITELLLTADLEIDPQLTIFIVAKIDSKIIACAGIDHNIIKCVAIHPDHQGKQLNLTLLDQTIKYAHEKGHFHLFLYTKPENKALFSGCGFYPVIELTDLIVLMENTPVGIRQYCKNLSIQRKEGAKIGSIVMNANPFTKGHQYLAKYAAESCDWLHLFVVNENASLFSFDERFQLVKEGTKGIGNITVHPSSAYIISKATFPTYFLKDQVKIDYAYMGIDLLIFRNYIAPALNITYRFVGSEPFSEITNAYNISMQHWLQDKNISSYPSVKLIEIERIKEDEVVISASLVRKLLVEKQYDQIKKIVPSTTWEYLKANLDKLTHEVKR